MRDSSKTFPAFDEPGRITALRVWFCKYQTLRQIEELSNVRTLVIAGYPDESFEPIGRLASLEYLSVVDFPKITSLEPLADLGQLRVLRLHCLPSWDSSGRVIQIESLAPIARLARLEHLELFGVGPANGSLSALESLPGLRSVRVSKYPPAEVDRFRAVSAVSDEFAPAPQVLGWA
jgi:hypothetical protein